MRHILIILFAILPLLVHAQEKKDSIQVFTEERPLIYEDAWDLWPYVS